MISDVPSSLSPATSYAGAASSSYTGPASSSYSDGPELSVTGDSHRGRITLAPSPSLTGASHLRRPTSRPRPRPIQPSTSLRPGRQAPLAGGRDRRSRTDAGPRGDRGLGGSPRGGGGCRS